MAEPVKTSKLASFRALFRTDIAGPEGIHLYVLPRTDAHQSEYINDCDKRVEFLSGFSGSNGYTIITESEALLWTDGRYFDQALKELADGWSLMKEGVPGTLTPTQWLALNLNEGLRVGFDPQLFGKGSGSDLVNTCKRAKAIPVPLSTNLVDVIWQDRPTPTINKLISLKKTEHGEDIVDKLKRVRAELKTRKCDLVIFSDLAQIAWLFNVRGNDIPYNPVFFSYALVTHDDAVLFINEEKLCPEVKEHLGEVKVLPYEAVKEWLRVYHEEAKQSITGHKIWVPSETNFALFSLLHGDYILDGPSPVYLFKALKNKVELEGMRQSHVRDSVALVQFFVWLKKELEAGNTVNEIAASDKIAEFRGKVDNFVSLSFDTISAVDEHAAQPHYHMTSESGKKVIKPESVYLLDSGGQYRDGTTDVTRTVIHTEPSAHVRKMFTLVLKGHINCARMTFPVGIDGGRLDSLARQPLWAHGYDFGHGTGHGVGHFLNVHEAPSSIGYRVQIPDGGIRKGMVITIEPGYYEVGNFGIRIENCYEIVEAPPLPSGAKNFVTFASLTWVPIQKNLIDKALLCPEEINWLNEYHNKCLEITGKYLQEKNLQDEYNYLAEACTPL